MIFKLVFESININQNMFSFYKLKISCILILNEIQKYILRLDFIQVLFV